MLKCHLISYFKWDFTAQPRRWRVECILTFISLHRLHQVYLKERNRVLTTSTLFFAPWDNRPKWTHKWRVWRARAWWAVHYTNESLRARRRAHYYPWTERETARSPYTVYNAASVPDVSLAMEIRAQRTEASPLLVLLPVVPRASSPVTRVSRSPLFATKVRNEASECSIYCLKTWYNVSISIWTKGKGWELSR